jgi:hypothetical protein
VRVACQLTRAHARLGDADRFKESLLDTRRRLADLPSLGSGLFSADAGRIASYAATSSIWLGEPKDAVGYANDALAFYAGTGGDERAPTREAISRLDLGLALICLRTPDRATAEAVRALNTERVTGSVLARAGELETALQRHYPSLPATRDFRERYRCLTARVGRPQLTA